MESPSRTAFSTAHGLISEASRVNDVCTVVTVLLRIDEETKRIMERIRIGWSEFIRNAIRGQDR